MAVPFLYSRPSPQHVKEKIKKNAFIKNQNTKKMNPAKVVLGPTHTAGPGSDSVKTPGSDSSHFI